MAASLHFTACPSPSSSAHTQCCAVASTSESINTTAAPALPSSSRKASLKASALRTLLTKMEAKQFDQAASWFEQHFNPHEQSLVDLCGGQCCDVRDVVVAMMRVYMVQGRMDKVRVVFMAALRDLAPRESPSLSSSPSRMNGSSVAKLSADEDEDNGYNAPSLLNTSVFNAYLEVLTRRKNYDVEEVLFVMEEMESARVQPDSLTYHYLIELHVRAGYDPQGLWNEQVHERQLRPLPATVQTILLRVVPSSPDSAFVVEVTREALRCGSAVMDKRMMAEMIEQWLQEKDTVATTTTTDDNAAGATSSSTSAISSPLSPSAAEPAMEGGPGGGTSLTSDTASSDSSKPLPTASGASSLSSNTMMTSFGYRYPAEYIMWLMLELEVRCVLDKSSFVQYIQKQHVAELLLRCARSADSVTASQVLALMDRHVMGKTADILALLVWCRAQALEVEQALDVVELMARKGYLEMTDPFRKFTVECLRMEMERHFLLTVADALGSVVLLERALGHLVLRRQRGRLVSVHTLDVLVLAASKLGEQRRAMHLVSTYASQWGVQPRTNTYNCLLVGSTALGGTMWQRTVYDAMMAAGVGPSPLTYRVLIRQAVLSDSIDEAVRYLLDVTKQPGLRVEVEMILPILERAARAGDVDTVNRVSQYALDCDIGIDGAVLQTVMKDLTSAGQSVDVLKGHQPLHEALRSRSKVGRQRVRHSLVL